MEREEAISYFQTLGQVARITENKEERALLYESERMTPYYLEAFQALRPAFTDEVVAEVEESPEVEILDPAVVWAQKTKSDYQRMIVGNSKERSNAKRMLQNGLGSVITGHIPLRTVVATWKSSSVQEEGEDTFFNTIVELIPAITKEKWKSIPPDILEHYFSLVANEDIVIDEAAKVLEAYVNSPQRKNDCAHMYYTLAQAAVLSSHDLKTMELALRVGTFATTVLPFDSAVYMNLYRVRQGNVIDEKDNEAFQKFLIAKQTFSLAEHLILKPGQESFVDREGRFVTTNKAECDRVFLQDVESMRSKVPREVFENRRKLMDEFNTGQKDDSKWPVTLELDSNDPLNMLYQEKLVDRVVGKLILDSQGDKHLATVPTPDGKILYILGDKSLKSKMGAVIRFALNHPPFEELVRPVGVSSPRTASFMNTEASFEGKKLQLVHRLASGSEESLHPLQVLDFVTLPEPRALEEEGKKNADQLSKALQRDQIRFITPRGIRIPLNKYPELKNLGYSAMEFKRNPDDPTALAGSLMIGNTAYEFNLNRYFLPDLAGKTLLSFDNLNNLTYIALQLLYPILCIENEYEAVGGNSESNAKFFSRMGFLRWLPEGHRFSKKAVNHCREFEDKDLYLLNFERMQRNNSSRESTYVRPVIAEDDSLPPVVVRTNTTLEFI